MRNIDKRSWKKKLELKKAFESANSVDKRLKVFKKMEKLFDESELGVECWKLAGELIDEGRSPEQVLSFGNRALRILITNDTKNIPCFGNPLSAVSVTMDLFGSPCNRNHKLSLYIAFICNLLASACLKLKRYDESLSYLNWGYRNLSKLLYDEETTNNSSGSCKCLSNTLLANQFGLFNLKIETGRFDEAVVTLRKALEIQEILMEEGCIQLGNTNELLCVIYSGLTDYEEALPFCLKALEIYSKRFGGNSVEVAEMMMHLVRIYNEFGEYVKALEQNQLSMNILKKMTPNSPKLLEAETDHGDILIGLGKYKEAIYVFKRVVSHTDTEEETRVSAFVSMARAFCYLEKFADAKKYTRTAQRILEKIEEDLNPMDVAVRFWDMSMLYEKMNDFENAISLLRRALSIPQIPRKFLAEGSARLFSLISLAGKEEEGIAYMENVVEILKKKFGVEHCEVAHGYKNLGATYLKSGQEELAVKFMVKAKDLVDGALGPHHRDSLKTSRALAETYATMGRYDPAIEILGKVVECLKVLEPREQEFLDIAVKQLNKMKESVAESPTGASPESKDDKDFSTEISKCGITDDENVLK